MAEEKAEAKAPEKTALEEACERVCTHPKICHPTVVNAIKAIPAMTARIEAERKAAKSKK